MTCTRCGWTFDEDADCFCSGCGRLLRGLTVAGKKKERYTLFFEGRSNLLSIPIENKGEHPVRINNHKPWEFIDLKYLVATIDGMIGPPIDFPPSFKRDLQIQFDDLHLPFSQAGKIRLFAGISLPLELNLCCSPVPVFYFYVNENMVRDANVQVITKPSDPFVLDFRIEVTRSPDAVWKSFRLYPEGLNRRAFPIPENIHFPTIINNGNPQNFSISVNINKFRSKDSSTKLIAEFTFEACSAEKFTIELITEPEIKHDQDIYLIDRNAVITGRSESRHIRVTLKNHGGLGAELIQVCSLSEPWLTIQSQPDVSELLAYEQSESNFDILVDPLLIEADEDPGGKILVCYRQLKSNDIKKVTIRIEIELRNPVCLYYPIAIDFGNSSSCVAMITNEEHKVELVKLERDFTKDLQECFEFPTIIDFEEFTPRNTEETGAGFRYGYSLEKTRYGCLSNDPGYIHNNNFIYRVWSFKSQIGQSSEPVTRFDRKNKILKSFTYDKLTYFYLKEVLKRFERNSFYETDKVIITYPANFTRSQINILRDSVSAIRPELKVITDISEPEAMTLHYLHNMDLDTPSLFFAVLDFGGATTDVSIGKLETKEGEKIISILLSVGIDQLGGDILTFQIATDLFKKALVNFDDRDYLFPRKFDDIFTIDMSKRIVHYNFMNFMKKAEDLKTDKDNMLKELLNRGMTYINIPTFYFKMDKAPSPCKFQYTAEDFTKITGELIKKGFEKVKALFEHLKEFNTIDKGNQLNLLILGGNSSRLELVKDSAKDVLGLSEENIFFNPEKAKTAVAEGAAYYSILRHSFNPDIIFNNPPCLKFPLVINPGDKQLEVLFPAGSKIGAKAARSWSLNAPDPVLAIYWNFDPSDFSFFGNPNIKRAAEYSLAKYKKGKSPRVKFNFELVNEGIKISTVDSEMPDLIKIEW